MQTQTVLVSQPEAAIRFNKEREILAKLFLKIAAIQDNSLALNDESIQILEKQDDAIKDRLVNTVSEIFVECLPPEFKKGTKSQPTIIKSVDSKEDERLNKRVELTKFITSLNDRITLTIKTITKPMRELLDCKVDEDLHTLQTEYSKLTQEKLEAKANNALSALTTFTETPKINTTDLTKAIADVNSQVLSLSKSTKTLMETFARLKKTCALRDEVRQPVFDIKSIPVESVMNDAIICSQWRDEFLKVREEQLKDFTATWQGKVDAAKKTAFTITKTRETLLAKLKTLNLPTAPVQEEAKVAASNARLAMAR